MAKRDYYDILGISKNASEVDIKSAYRRLARAHHPDIDKSPGASEKFKEISEAYQILSDPQKRRSYDQFGQSAFSSSASSSSYQGNPFSGGFNPFSGGFEYSWSSSSQTSRGFEDPFDLFEEIFGGGFGEVFRRRPTYRMDLSFDEAINGVSKEIEIEKRERNGGIKRERMTIKVPAGVDEGTRMRFGDIEIVFRVKDHPEFDRKGQNIFSNINLTIPQIVLGDIIEVDTVSGKVKVKVPPGSEPGSMVKIKGKGVASLKGGKGDHYLKIMLKVPKSLTAKERSLYENLKNLSDKKGWF